MKNGIRFISSILVGAVLLGSCLFMLSAADAEAVYPELVITEIGMDQRGDKDNTKNTNPLFCDTSSDRDPFEFIEIYNNSDKAVNIFDYMLAYQGCDSTDARSEKSIGLYTPIYPGYDWTDGAFAAYDRYWEDSGKERPQNPAYSGGVIASGEVAVIWVYTVDSHTLLSTVDEFRAFWSIDDETKVFMLDGGDASELNFSIKNTDTATYSILHQSDRFSKRRSTDSTFGAEYDNLHHPYENENYETLEEVISWAVVDYTSSPIKDSASDKANCTVSYLPATGNAAEANGYTKAAFESLKRMHIEKLNTYEEATVGKLNGEQAKAFEKTKTTVVRTKASPAVSIDEASGRPSLIITEIGTDQYVNVEQNTNDKATGGKDVYEFLEVYNNSEHDINIYDYMIGFQSAGAGNVSTRFERLVEKYTPIYPGYDWIDAPYTECDSYWEDAERPVNPEYEDGVLKAGEVAVLWSYSKASHDTQSTIAHFRAFWSIPDSVKVFLFDGNSTYGNKNFSLVNSETATYVIMKACDKYPTRRGDDETFETDGGLHLSRYYNLKEDWTYETAPEIISWAVVCYDSYDPLYTYYNENGKNAAKNNYTMSYAPYNGEAVFGNGFLTVSFESRKRMHLTGVGTDSTVGTLTEAQKDRIASALPK